MRFEEAFVVFMRTHSKQFIDETCMLKYGVYTEEPLMKKDTEVNQQLSDVALNRNNSSSFGKGSIVKLVQNDTSKIVVVASGFRTSAGETRYEILRLNGTTNSVASLLQLKETTPRPADIPPGSSDVDAEVLKKILSREDF